MTLYRNREVTCESVATRAVLARTPSTTVVTFSVSHSYQYYMNRRYLNLSVNYRALHLLLALCLPMLTSIRILGAVYQKYA